MTALTEAKDNYIAEIGGLSVALAGQVQPVQFPRVAEWQPVEAIAGLFMRPVPVPDDPDSDYFFTRGAAGVRAELVSVPQAAMLTILRGAMRWWQESSGGPPRRLEAGQSVSLQPYERHSYEFLEYCVNSLVMTPPLAFHHPPVS